MTDRLTDAQREDLDETRRLIYSVSMRPFGVKPSAEMLGTIANALRHHSNLMDDRALAAWISGGMQAAGLIPYVSEITALLEADDAHPSRTPRKPID